MVFFFFLVFFFLFWEIFFFFFFFKNLVVDGLGVRANWEKIGAIKRGKRERTGDEVGGKRPRKGAKLGGKWAGFSLVLSFRKSVYAFFKTSKQQQAS